MTSAAVLSLAVRKSVAAKPGKVGKQSEASARQNLGSIELNATTGRPLLNKQGRILRVNNLADARVDKRKGVVVCSTVPADQPPYYNAHGFPMGVLHTFDYPLYFFSVRANAKARAEHFLASHPGRG